MVKIQEHIEKMQEIKRQMKLAKSPMIKRDLKKAYYRMNKELKIAKQYLKENNPS